MSSTVKFFLFSWQNLDFKYSLETEMIVEEEENKRFNNCVTLNVWLIKNPWMSTSFKEEGHNRLNLGVIVYSSSIIDRNGKMKSASMSLNCGHQIFIEASRFRRIITYTQMAIKRLLFDLQRMPMMLTYITQRSPLGALNLDHYNSSMDGWDLPSFIEQIIAKSKCVTCPSRLSENWCHITYASYSIIKSNVSPSATSPMIKHKEKYSYIRKIQGISENISSSALRG